MSKASALFGRGERERLRQYVSAWDNKLALDTQHIAAIRARLESASIASTDQVRNARRRVVQHRVGRTGHKGSDLRQR